MKQNIIIANWNDLRGLSGVYYNQYPAYKHNGRLDRRYLAIDGDSYMFLPDLESEKDANMASLERESKQFLSERVHGEWTYIMDIEQFYLMRL